MKVEKVKHTLKDAALSGIVFVALASTGLMGCNGGSSGGGYSGGGGGVVISGPYENVFGEGCSSDVPIPGCTFNTDGTRVDVTQDYDYDYLGGLEHDLWELEFDSSGEFADVYDEFGEFQYTAHISEFDGWVGGSTIGVGNSGLYWEDVNNGLYKWSSTGVIYNYNFGETNYGEAINNQSAGDAADVDIVAMQDEANEELVNLGAKHLIDKYGFKKDKAVAVASSLNSFGLSAVARGHSTIDDIHNTFEATFGVDYQSALTAAMKLRKGESQDMKAVVHRSASALGITPDQAKDFLSDSYGKALSSFGYDTDALDF